MKLLNFRKQYLYQIDFYINTKCNTICKYCYARKDFNWGHELDEKKIFYTLTLLDKYLPNSFLSFIGGEPTIYPNFKKVLQKSLKYKNLQFHFYTNGIKDLSQILNFYDSTFFKITLSLHINVFKNNYENFKKNIDYLIKNNFDFDLTFVFYDDYDFIKEFKNLVKKIGLKRIHISTIHDFFSKKNLQIYLKKYNDFLKENNIKNYKIKNFSQIKKCFYNEIRVRFNEKSTFLELNNCNKKFFNENIKFRNINNKILLTPKNLKLLSKRKKFILCKDDCIYDSAFYGSWEPINLKDY